MGTLTWNLNVISFNDRYERSNLRRLLHIAEREGYRAAHEIIPEAHISTVRQWCKRAGLNVSARSGDPRSLEIMAGWS